MIRNQQMEEYNNKLFVIDKDAGPTSFDVVAAFKRAARLRKVGHTGTLDPLARGVLLICTGMATRAVEHFMNLEKEYQFDICLGRETDTLDAQGKTVREESCPAIPDERVLEVADSFVGEYELTPPVFSALKKDGRRLYEMARAGEKPKVESRVVQIYECQVRSIELPIVSCSVRCSRGTYVRSLAKDFGDRLGVPAHIDHIVRKRIGPFEQNDGFPSDRVFDKDISGLRGVDLSHALAFMPAAVLGENAVEALRYGMLPGIRDVVNTIGEIKGEGSLRLLDETGGLLAIGHRDRDRRKNPLRLVDSYRLCVDLTGKKGAKSA
jgi:tRNA pseudouridine55 synthase